MGRNPIKNKGYQGDFGFMTIQMIAPSTNIDNAMINERLAYHVLQAAIDCGVREFCICAGSRNAPFVITLANNPHIKQYFWPEERSAAFFALGKSRKTMRPVAIVVTSGTAVGEILPAIMEAYYNGVPLLVLSADRPRRMRGTGAPQTAHQVGIFGHHAVFSQDLAAGEEIQLHSWMQEGPCHLNVCFDEPLGKEYKDQMLLSYGLESEVSDVIPHFSLQDKSKLDDFLQSSKNPLVIVSTLKIQDKEAVAQFLMKLQAPIYFEGISNLREDPRLQHLAITRTNNLWDPSTKAGYPIDGVLRIGGVPTVRLWRDLEGKYGQLKLLSVNDVPFSGSSWGKLIFAPLASFFNQYDPPDGIDFSHAARWIAEDQRFQQNLQELFIEEPRAEASLFASLSHKIPSRSFIYLGNSLPIREWDLAASRRNQDLTVMANKGLIGIDGQVSTFLGMAQPGISNWGIFGDLTMLFDMVGPWILSQMKEANVNIVVVNNSGGKIFTRLYPQEQFLNRHQLKFEALATFWKLAFERWELIPQDITSRENRFIEIIPDEEATNRFWQKLSKI
jgi:2-succinyl-5-enolpyruvyl-6-hydroxy-3-cyclohexene-1-carboxylate synthase